MEYTTMEICDILGVKQNTIWSWINKGIVSCHPSHTGEVIKLKAKMFAGDRRGGKYYLINVNDLNDFLLEVYYTSYFYKWWRK